MTLRCEGISFTYRKGGRVQALVGVSAEASPGQVCAIVGRNGSGKSTLLRLCCGLASPASGAVSWRGVDLHRLKEPERAMRCAYVPQRPWTSAAFTVRELVELAVGTRGRGLRDPDQALDMLGLTALADRGWHEVSEGERSRAIVARALVQSRPDGMLVLDEPFASLDPGECARLTEVLRQVAAQGVLVVAAIHQIGIASALARSVWWLEQGRMLASGPAAGVLEPGALARTFGVPFERLGGQLVPMLAPAP